MSVHPGVSSSSTSPAASAPTITEWDVDQAHSHAQFGVRHMMVSTVRGTFDKLSGTVSIDENDPTRSKIDIQIDANTVNTREPKRDAHLRSADFFDVEKHPTITFKSTAIERAGQGAYRVTGDLSMHGITKSVTLAVEGPTAEQKTPWGTITRGLSATGKVNRKDWGLNWNAAIEAGGVLVGEDVQITFEAELVPHASVS
jgi:polyisoprenoid-binding protein YceI